MNIGIRLHDTAPGPLKERLGFARAQGFSCAHVALSKVLDDFAMEDAPEKLTDEYARRIRKEFDESGLECAVLGCYLNLTHPDPEELERYVVKHSSDEWRLGKTPRFDYEATCRFPWGGGQGRACGGWCLCRRSSSLSDAAMSFRWESGVESLELRV